MTDKLDFTQPLALRRDPFTRFEGPFIGPDWNDRMYSVVDRMLIRWEINGQAVGCHLVTCDLIPLQVAPVKWLTRWVNRYPDDKFGGTYSTKGDALRHGLAGANEYEMIERAAFDMLHEAMKVIATDQWADPRIAARNILAKVEAKL